jgi:hypothetical protein
MFKAKSVIRHGSGEGDQRPATMGWGKGKEENERKEDVHGRKEDDRERNQLCHRGGLWGVRAKLPPSRPGRATQWPDISSSTIWNWFPLSWQWFLFTFPFKLS